eukprot:PhM_4_TR11010/c0_g1_i1/m.27870
MLRRTVGTSYRYREFEFSKNAQLIYHYPREAPNTSYFPQFFMMHHMSWGWGKEELWVDKETRRYETTWQMWRKVFMAFIPMFYIFPIGLPQLYLSWRYGDHGKNPWMSNKMPMDRLYVEWGGHTLDHEWVRHIHSNESY